MAQMHRLFPDWLTTLSADAPVNSLPVNEWWSAVDSLTGAASAADVVQIARAAFRRPTTEFDTRWRELLREHDPVSPLQGSGRQVAILAAAALIQLSEVGGSHAAAAIYARRCGTHLGWSPALDDLTVGDRALADLAHEERTMSPWPAFKSRPAIRLDTAIAGLVDGQPVAGDAVKASLEAFATSVGDVIARTARSLSSAGQSRESTLNEQSEVISWLLAGQCRALQRDWEEASPSAAAVLAAVDLWRMTPFELGRPDHAALIGQAVDAAKGAKGNSVKTADLRDALEGAGYRADLAHSDLLGTCAAVAAGEGIDAAPVKLGVRVHDELLLAHALKQGE